MAEDASGAATDAVHGVRDRASRMGSKTASRASAISGRAGQLMQELFET
ncbi:hypothetical protein [Mesorhizobium sp.]|nr:hypothetical protein [Mesorhizobium sp.]